MQATVSYTVDDFLLTRWGDQVSSFYKILPIRFVRPAKAPAHHPNSSKLASNCWDKCGRRTPSDLCIPPCRMLTINLPKTTNQPQPPSCRLVIILDHLNNRSHESRLGISYSFFCHFWILVICNRSLISYSNIQLIKMLFELIFTQKCHNIILKNH